MSKVENLKKNRQAVIAKQPQEKVSEQMGESVLLVYSGVVHQKDLQIIYSTLKKKNKKNKCGDPGTP